MIWMVLFGLLFAFSGAMEAQGDVVMPACPSIDAEMALQAHFQGSQVSIIKQEYKRCNNMEAVVEVEAYVDGKKMEFVLTKRGNDGNVNIRLKEGEGYYEDSYEYEYEREYKKEYRPVPPLPKGTNNSVIIVDGKASFWFFKGDSVVKIEDGHKASCSGRADMVWVAMPGYPIKTLNISEPGCYYVSFKNDSVEFKANCTQSGPIYYPMERRVEVEVEQKLKAKVGDDVKIINVTPEGNGKARVKYKAYIRIPFLGITLPIETEYEEEIELES